VLSESDNYDDAVQRLISVPINTKFLSKFSDLLRDALETSEALGRSLIVEKDRLLSISDDIVSGHYLSELSWIVCEDNLVKITFDLLPKKALEYLNYKAITIAGIEHDQILFDVKKRLLAAIKEGIKFEEWRQSIDEFFDGLGVEKLHPRHAETVFRTNILSSFGIGQLEQAMSMSERFPMWKYSAINDSATRPEHAQYDGKIFKVGEGPIPPIDYNCRCTAIYLHVTQTSNVNPEKWKIDRVTVRFNNRKTFDQWKREKEKSVVTPEVKEWMSKNS